MTDAEIARLREVDRRARALAHAHRGCWPLEPYTQPSPRTSVSHADYNAALLALVALFPEVTP